MAKNAIKLIVKLFCPLPVSALLSFTFLYSAFKPLLYTTTTHTHTPVQLVVSRCVQKTVLFLTALSSSSCTLLSPQMLNRALISSSDQAESQFIVASMYLQFHTYKPLQLFTCNWLSAKPDRMRRRTTCRMWIGYQIDM